MKMKEIGPPGGVRVPGAPLGSANAMGQKSINIWIILTGSLNVST